MHHTGLAQNRYDVVNSSLSPAKATRSKLEPERARTVQELEADQRATIATFPADAERQIRHNYHLLQVFDLMSLYLCCDGYDDAGMRPLTLEPVPMAFASGTTARLTLTPLDSHSIRVQPYPFDTPSFKVCVEARRVRNAPGEGEVACRLAYVGGARLPLVWTITN
jgi:hypothetical protein